jgi:hypothetical protein
MATMTVQVNIPSVIFGSYQSYSAKSGGTLYAGQFVMPNATTGAVTMCTDTACGVCAQSAVATEMVTVITHGIVNVANDDDTTVIPAGKGVKVGAFGGVLLAVPGEKTVGVTIDPFAGGGYGRIVLALGAI